MVKLVMLMLSKCYAGWFFGSASSGYTACMTACMAPPTSIASSCGRSCSGGGYWFVDAACFADGTTILVNRNGSLTMESVQQLETGMLVETFDADHGTQKWVEVMSLVRHESEFRHVRITLDGLSKPLTVTAEHLTPRAGSGAQLELVTAAELKVADFIPTYQSGRLELARVQDVEHLVLPHRNVLVTRDGTVMADGVLTTTVCDGEFGIKAEERGNFTEAMRGWREIHEPKFKSM